MLSDRVLSILRNIRGILEEGCRSISILGMGGIGKTALSVKLAAEIAAEIAEGAQVSLNSATVPNSFQFILWRTLRNAPPVETLVADLIRVLSGDRLKEADLPADAAERVSRLMEFLRRLAHTAHSSCLVLTSRKNPRDLYFWAIVSVIF